MPDAATLMISVLGGVGTGIVTLFGVHFQQRFLANTEMISKTLVELEDMTAKCAETSIEAWNLPGDPNGKETVSTVCQLHTMAEFMTFIEDRVNLSRLRLSSPFVNFRRATSGEQFDVTGREPSPDKAVAVYAAAASMRIALRTVDYERRKLYLPFF